ncbi:hypothetical protein CEE69_18150 [Rhodopirellula bahusiensis]|uniref:Uncharacterized protein n=1 Tax=Rhodopirellula bahusiensis TaxID=2014065 RepID=A0A2G1W4B1_9BACT|nr:hypothetical protein CEE69_18150 [Rhodopirellula bahusiensis]
MFFKAQRTRKWHNRLIQWCRSTKRMDVPFELKMATAESSLSAKISPTFSGKTSRVFVFRDGSGIGPVIAIAGCNCRTLDLDLPL